MAGKKSFFKPIGTGGLTAFNVSYLVYNDACDFTVGNDYSPYSTTLYHNGPEAIPKVDDIVYTDAGGTTTLAPNGYYLELTLTNITIGPGGVVIPTKCK